MNSLPVTMCSVRACLCLLFLQLGGVTATVCPIVKVEEAKLNPEINAPFHSSNYICHKGDTALIYYTHVPPKVSQTQFSASFNGKNVAEPTTSSPQVPTGALTWHADIVSTSVSTARAQTTSRASDYSSTILSTGSPIPTTHTPATETTSKTTQSSSTIVSTTSAEHLTTTSEPDKTNYYLFRYENYWRIGTVYCESNSNVAKVFDEATNPLDIRNIWSEKSQINNSWVPAVSISVVCGTAMTTEEMYVVVIGAIIVTGLIVMTALFFKKRREESWERLQEEQCDNEGGDGIAPEDVTFEPPSYATVISEEVPPPVYDDIMSSVSQHSASPPPNYLVSIEEPPAYQTTCPEGHQNASDAPVQVFSTAESGQPVV